MSTNKKNHALLVAYIKENQASFYRVAFAYTKSREDALDIVQDAIYKGLRASSQIRDRQYLKTWFYRILINTAISHQKKQRQVVPIESIGEKEAKTGLDRADICDLYDALDHLSEEDKTLIVLRFFEDQKFSEIAEVTGKNINSVKTRVYSILNKLRVVLDCEVNRDA